jgi:hypothetical protein
MKKLLDKVITEEIRDQEGILVNTGCTGERCSGAYAPTGHSRRDYVFGVLAFRLKGNTKSNVHDIGNLT